MSVWNERAQAVRETVEAVRAIEAEGVTRESLAKIGETLVGLATRTELFLLEQFPVRKEGGIYRLAEDPDHRFALYASAGLEGKLVAPHNHTTWAVIAGAGTEAGGEHLAVVGQDPLGHPVAGHGQLQRLAHRLGHGPSYHPGRDHEAAVVVDPRDDLGLPAIGQTDPADDVHLPQLHRPAPLPTLVIRTLPSPRLRRDQPVADQAPLHRRATRQRDHPLPLEPIHDRPRPPPRMLTAHLHHPGLHHRVHLVRTRQRPRRPIGQPSKPMRRVLPQPLVHRLARHPITTSHVGHRRPIDEHFQHRLITLLHQVQLHEHRRPPPDLRARTTHSEEGDAPKVVDLRLSARNRGHCRPGTGAASRECQPATGATMSSMNRVRTTGTEESVTILCPDTMRGPSGKGLSPAHFLAARTGFEPVSPP